MIAEDIEKQVKYLNNRNGIVVKYSNTDDFPELSPETANFLKNNGVYSYKWGVPRLLTDGILRYFRGNLIEIGSQPILDDHKYCIDTATQNVVLYTAYNNEISIVNSSIETFLRSQYTFIYYSMEIEGEKYGEFYEDENYKKYAKLLREMLNEVEPSGIQNFILWEEKIHEKELGVC